MLLLCELVVVLVPLVLAQGPSSGPVGPITIFEVGSCPDNNVNLVGLSATLNIDDDGMRSLSFVLDTPIGLDDDTELSLVIDKWDQNSWQKDFYTNDGTFNDLIDQYIKTIWGKISSQMEPALENNRVIEPGHYELNNYIDVYESVDLPQIFYGRFKAYFTVTKDDEDILCVMAEAEAQDP